MELSGGGIMMQSTNESKSRNVQIARWAVILAGAVLGVALLRHVYYDVALVEAYVRLR